MPDYWQTSIIPPIIFYTPRRSPEFPHDLQTPPAPHSCILMTRTVRQILLRTVSRRLGTSASPAGRHLGSSCPPNSKSSVLVFGSPSLLPAAPSLLLSRYSAEPRCKNQSEESAVDLENGAVDYRPSAFKYKAQSRLVGRRS